MNRSKISSLDHPRELSFSFGYICSRQFHRLQSKSYRNPLPRQTFPFAYKKRKKFSHFEIEQLIINFHQHLCTWTELSTWNTPIRYREETSFYLFLYFRWFEGFHEKENPIFRRNFWKLFVPTLSFSLQFRQLKKRKNNWFLIFSRPVSKFCLRINVDRHILHDCRL